jgi:hypothetical protein
VRTFVVALLIGAAVTHLAWSSAMALILSSSYPHRIMDVRRWPDPVSVKGVAEMVSMFLSHAITPATAPHTVFFGSSVAYGFPWQEDVVVSTRYAALRPAEHVVNASVIGNDVAFLEDAVLCGATNAGLQADVVIVELPVINSVINLMRRTDDSQPERCDETIGRVGYWSFAARHPIGAGWLSFIWDDKAFPKADANITIGAVFFGYFGGARDFAKVEPDFRRQVVAALERAKTLGRRVYAFPSPVFVPGVREAGFDAASVQTQLTSALTACQTVSGVHCLDPQQFYTRRDAYFNLTHLNQRGHQALAEWLAANIEPAAK